MNKQTLKMAAAFLTGAVAGAAGVYKVLYGYFEKERLKKFSSSMTSISRP